MPAGEEQTIFFRLLAERVRRLRLSRNWTQEDMEAHGFSVRHYQQIEAGHPITLATALRLSEAFEMDVTRLLRGLHARSRMLGAMTTAEARSRFPSRPPGRPTSRKRSKK